MSSTESLEMHRSISMPTQPKHLETKILKRSEERETVFEEDYYPESPHREQRKRLLTNPEIQMGLRSKSENDFPFSSEWVGSTIELDQPETRRRETGSFCRRPHRVIGKNGRENVSFRRIPQKSWRYFRDFVTTLIELKWKYMLTMFVSSFFTSWFLFAGLCYMVSYSHGDFFFDVETGQRMGDGKVPCVVGVYDFTSMLVYSVETQTTIGFGEKYPSEECPETMFLFILQIICSIAIEGGMVSIIYAKTARPAKQITKMKFSDKAVICYRDGKLCLLFRVCDPREQQSIESKIRVYLIVDRFTTEGEVVKTHVELKLENNGEQIISWPELVCHVIDERSPLSCFRSAKAFNAAQFELYVSSVGTSPTTAQITEARTSYIPREIFWGQRFINIITYDALKERYVVDYSHFNSTISVDMNH